MKLVKDQREYHHIQKRHDDRWTATQITVYQVYMTEVEGIEGRLIIRVSSGHGATGMEQLPLGWFAT